MMKILKFLQYTNLILIFEFLKRAIISGILILFFVCPTLAKGTGTLTGYVTDEEFDVPLEKAVVSIPGTFVSVITDQQGRFILNLMGGDYVLEVFYPGFFPKKYNITVAEGVETPMFIIKLKVNAIGRIFQRNISFLENKHQFPHGIEDFSLWQIDEQKGHQEFNEILKPIPSVTFLTNGNGYNDSETGFRGNDPTQTSYCFNGILLNNPENGRISSSILSGLTDWAGQIQVTNGVAANLEDQLKPGGLVNILSYVPRQKAGTDLLTIIGKGGFLKTSATIHSGLSKKGFTSSLQISRTIGNGLVQNTAFKQYGFFVDLRKEINRKNTLVLNLNGTIQQHDRNASDSIGAYNINGTNYNRQWGMINNKTLSWSTNFGRSPLFSLTHFWQPRSKTRINSLIYSQFDRSAQLNLGKVSGNQLMNSGNPGNIVFASIDSETRIGLRSVVTHDFSDEFNLIGGLNFEQYHASHFGAVNDLLGLGSYTSFSDINRQEGFESGSLFQPKILTSFNSADKTDYFYESGIQSGGLSVRINYQTSRVFWYLEGTSSIQNLKRTDHFNYLVTDPDRKTNSTLLPGGRVQTGFSFHFWKYHSIHLKSSFGSFQPLFTELFPAGNNWKNKAINEQIFDAEFGYTIFSRKLKFEALAYRSQIAGRSMVRYSNLNPGDSYALANGLEELHQGVELKLAYKMTDNFKINMNGSFGDWRYSKDAKAQFFDVKNQLLKTNDLLIKDVMIANAPQLSIFAEGEWRLSQNFYARINFYKADRIVAPFSFNDFIHLADRADFVLWKLPAYQTLGISGNYLLRVRKSLMVDILFGAQNLLDTEYIEQSATNLIEKNPRYTSNQVYYGTGRTWFLGLKVQF